MTEPAAARDVLQRLRESARPRVLMVAHGSGGGVARHVGDLATALDAAAEVLVLQPWHGSHAELRLPPSPVSLFFDMADEWDAMVHTLRAVGVSRVHYHHVHGWPPRVLQLARDLDAPYFVTLHDFYPACAAYHLVDAHGRYCGAPPDCTRCTEGRAAQWPLDALRWRAAFAPWLAAAARVIAPSTAAAQTVQGFFPAVRAAVWPHPERVSDEHVAGHRVLVPGAISPEKGLHVLEACMQDAAARGLPLHFRVVGHLAQPLERWPRAPLSVAGEYPEGALGELLDLERGDVAFFPAQVPETFSYTLSAAMDAGLPIVATDLGALPQRLTSHGPHRIVPWNAGAAAMNDALLAIAREPPSRPIAVRPFMDFATYRARYLEGLEARAPAHALPDIEAGWLEAPEPPPSIWTFFGLVQEALGRGRAIPLADLERRAREADQRLEDASGRKAELDEWHRATEAYFAGLRRELEAEAARQRERTARAEAEAAGLRDGFASMQGELARMRSSLSWRLTRPLRALRRLLRR